MNKLMNIIALTIVMGMIFYTFIQVYLPVLQKRKELMLEKLEKNNNNKKEEEEEDEDEGRREA